MRRLREPRWWCALLLVPAVLHGQGGPVDDRPATVRAAARVLASADQRALDLGLVDSILRSPAPPPWLLQAAIRAVGQTGSRALAPQVRQLVSHPDTAVAATATFALGLLRDTASIDVLVDAVRRTGAVHDEAAAALRWLGPGGRTALIDVLRGGPSSAVLHALALVEQVPTELIVPLAQHPDGAVRAAAVYALTRSPQRGAAAALMAALDASAAPADQSAPLAGVRAATARGLSRNAVPDSLQPAARVVLGRLVFDAHPHVRVAAVTALSTYAAASPGILQRLLAEDPDPNVRVAAAQAGTAVFGPDPDAWEAAWRADSSRATRAALLQGAARHGILLGDAPGDPSPWRTHPDPRRRALFAATVIADREEQRFERAAPFRADSSPEVVRAVVAIFARRDSARPPDVDAWLRTLAVEAADPWVRTSALRGVVANAPSDVLPVITAAYARAASDANPTARHAALTALVELWGRDSAALRPLADSLARWPVPGDPRERAIGGRLPGLAHWTRSDAGGRSLADWDAVVRDLVLPTVRGAPLRATLTTEHGEIVVELAGDVAPTTVANLRDLSARGYFDGVEWHRVVPNFVAQVGDPSGTGSGGPGYSIRDELNRHPYHRGALGMALSGPDTGGSQWFITLSPQPHLDGGYTVFGRVVSGLEVVDAIAQWDRLVRVRVQ